MTSSVEGSHGKQRAHFYGCTSYHLRGRKTCTNHIEVPMLDANRELLDAFASDILRPEHVERVIRSVVEKLKPSTKECEARYAAVHAELTTVNAEIERLTAAIMSGAKVNALHDRRAYEPRSPEEGLAARTCWPGRREAATARHDEDRGRSTTTVEGVARPPADRDDPSSTADDPEADRSEPAARRRTVQERRPARLGVPSEARLGKLLAGLLPENTNTVASPTGFEPVSWP